MVTHEDIMIYNDPLFPLTPIVLKNISLYIINVLFLKDPLETLIGITLMVKGNLLMSHITSFLHCMCIHIDPKIFWSNHFIKKKHPQINKQHNHPNSFSCFPDFENMLIIIWFYVLVEAYIYVWNKRFSSFIFIDWSHV